MDPLSIGSSAFSLHQRENEEQKADDAFREIIASCRSLSKYDSGTFRSALPQILSAVSAASFHIVIGISLAFSAILVPQVEDPNSDLKLSLAESSWCASVIVIAVPVGCIFAGLLMEYMGRLNTIKIAVIPCVIGWVLIAKADSFLMLLIGRILTGLACAIGTSPAYVYITEVARPELRGSLLTSSPIIASLGMVIAYTKGAFMTWRMAAWCGIGYSLIPAILIQFLATESPVWLVSKGRVEDAAKSLKYLYKYYPQPEHTTQTLADMHLQALQRDQESKYMTKNFSKSDFTQISEYNKITSSKMAHFKKPTGYKPVIVLFWLFLIQQFSGIYITLFYAVTFIQDVGAKVDPFYASICIGVTRFLMSLGNAWLLKRFKRRPLIMVSTIGMTVCMSLSGLVTYWIKTGTTDHTWIPVACILLYVCFSMIGLLSIPWTMTAELYPQEIRGIGHSISYSMGNFLMFCAVQSYRYLVIFLGGAWAVQLFFAGVSTIGFVFVLFFLPETAGKKLEDIQAFFEPKKSKKGKKKGTQSKAQQNSYSKKPNLATVEEAEKMISSHDNKV